MDEHLASPQIRPVRPTDREALCAFYAALSPASRSMRFHGAAPCLSDAVARSFCSPDHEHREGLVAVVVAPDGQATRESIVGHVCIEPAGDGTAELAVVVADEWRGHGLGHDLVEAAVAWAAGHACPRLLAVMRWGNAPMLGTLRSLGLPMRCLPSDPMAVEVELRVGPTTAAA